MSPECNKAWAGNVQLHPVMNTDISWGNPSVLLQWECAHRSPEGQHTETPHPACTLKIILTSMPFHWRIRKFLEISKQLHFCKIKCSHGSVEKINHQCCTKMFNNNKVLTPSSCKTPKVLQNRLKTNFNPKFLLKHKFNILPIAIILTAVTD